MLKIFAISALLIPSICVAQPNAAYSKACETSSGRVNLSQSDVLGVRAPYLGGSASIWGGNSSDWLGEVPASCKAEEAQVEANWNQNDLSNWESLANRACSARQGWVLNAGATCTAGGPPPICVQNHWHQDPMHAMAAWEAEQQRVSQIRSQELRETACRCWRNSVQPVRDDSAPAPSPQQISNTIVVPCSGSCTGIPGATCRQGFCVIDSMGPAKEAAAGQGKELLQTAFEKLIKDSFPEIAVLEESMLGKALGPAGEFLNPTPLEDWGASYKASITKVQQLLERMRVDIAEYQRIGYAANVWADRDQLQQQLDSMNSVAAGMIQVSGLGQNACYSVIDYENSALNASFALMFSKMPPRPQVGTRLP